MYLIVVLFIEGFLHRLLEITQQIVVFTISRHLTLINLDKDKSNCKDSKMRDRGVGTGEAGEARASSDFRG